MALRAHAVARGAHRHARLGERLECHDALIASGERAQGVGVGVTTAWHAATVRHAASVRSSEAIPVEGRGMWTAAGVPARALSNAAAR
jgi:hypothetical protein